ncbi:MAG: histidine--tRNA ligase [Thermoleophilaceae bacterium]|nr:histidine--tRNA ligase [Thermoleophilaceae bacterium]
MAASRSQVRAIEAPRGTFDVLPGDGRPRRELGRLAEEILERAGYGYAETPAFESAELFARGVGEATDIVQKEMFAFEDQGGRALALRPENTAGFCRAYVEHGMHKRPQPVKLWYEGPFFRHEAPQAGRFRQFAQIGAEALGSDDPSLDAELIVLLADLLARAGVGEVRLRLSSLGTAPTRHAYAEELRDYLRARENELSAEVVARLDLNPLRAFDSAHPGTRSALAEAPRLLDRLEPEDAEHFAAVRGLLDDARVAYEVDPALVRGLDYYTRTVFEFTSDRLGAQSGVGGGGRYDGLVEQLGGPPTPAVGWAAGVERILLAAQAGDGTDGDGRLDEEVRRAPVVFVALEGKSGTRAGFSILRALWRAGARAEMEQAGRSLKGQLKQASRAGARAVVIVDDVGVRVRDMRAREEQPATDAGHAVELALALAGAL